MKGLWMQGEDLNQLDDAGQTPLSHAAINGSVNVVKWLCSLDDFDTDFTNKEGVTALAHLCKMRPIQGWVHVGEQKKKEKTMEICRVLLEHPKVKADRPDLRGRAPFSYAVENCLLEIAEMLLSVGSVDPNSKCNRRSGASRLYIGLNNQIRQNLPEL